MQVDKDNFSEWFSEIVEKCDVVDLRFPVKGMPVYKGWGFTALRNCFKLLEKLLNDSGHEEMLFPLLVPEDLFGKEADHIKGFGTEVMWATEAGGEQLERKLAIRPTSETIMYPMFSLWIRTHADMPLRVHQTCCVYRHDTKMTRPLIRGREIYWNEAHTAHATKEDAENQVKEGVRIYTEVYRSLGVPFKPLVRPEFDKFPGADYSIAFDVVMPDGRVMQAATVHNLGQNFSKVYGIEFDNPDGTKGNAFMTCYGLSMRCLASVIAVHGDEKGLVMPPEISPLQVVVVPIFSGAAREKIVAACKGIETRLKNAGFRVKVDEKDTRPGEKYYFWESRGVPLRIELGPKDLDKNQVVLAPRIGSKQFVATENLEQSVSLALQEAHSNLSRIAKEKFEAWISNASSFEELKQIMAEKAGLVKAGWCGSKECADEIKTKTTSEVRGFENGVVEDVPCIYCKKPGLAAWFAKAY